MLKIICILIFLDVCIKCHSHPSAQEFLERRTIQKKRTEPPTTPTTSTTTKSTPAATPIPRRDPEIGAQPVAALGAVAAPALQWHAGVYSTADTPYAQICGGSIVKRDVVISAAHCFWTDDIGALHAALFAVAAGKLLRTWGALEDAYAQHSDVKAIHIPVRYRGSATSFQSDLAVLLLSTPLEYAPGVQPVCVGFNSTLDQLLLQRENRGTITGWGLTEQNGEPATRLNYLKLPYIETDECFNRVEPSFQKFLTSDKICAGFWDTGKALCRGDSGGGLVYNFTVGNSSMIIPYLLGVASTAQRDENQCNANTPASFTHLSFHEEFLKRHVPGLEAECGEVYKQMPREQEQVDRNERTPSSVAPSVAASTPPRAADAQPSASLPPPAAPGLQWHATVYNKSATPYAPVCGGSVVSRDFIITAANCFWDDATGALSTASFAAAAGKLLKSWDAQDLHVQKSDIASVHIPAMFRGARAHYAHDIAAARLRTPLRYTPGVQPLCVSFDPRLQHRDQWTDSVGKPLEWRQWIVGWLDLTSYAKPGLITEDILVNDKDDCIRKYNNPDYSKHFTSDKICAGSYLTTLAFCEGESGNGLVHYSLLNNSSAIVPYLYAVGSTLKSIESACKVPPKNLIPATFTHVLYHKEFLKELIPDLEDECNRVYMPREQSAQGLTDESGRPDQSRLNAQSDQNKGNENKAEVEVNTPSQNDNSSLALDLTQAASPDATPLPAGSNIVQAGPHVLRPKTPEGVSVAVSNGTVRITVTSAHTVTIELPQAALTN